MGAKGGEGHDNAPHEPTARARSLQPLQSLRTMAAEACARAPRGRPAPRAENSPMHGKAAHTPRPDPGENPERGKVRSKPGMGRRATATVVVPVPRPKPGKTPVRSRGHDERAMAATKIGAALARVAARRGAGASII